MALELLPDGTFKKLTKVQTDALNRYYKRENKRDLTTEAIISGLPIILGVSIASVAYVFRDDIKEKVVTALEEATIPIGFGLAKAITRFTRGEQNIPTEPRTSETTIEGNVLSKCQRYAGDYVDQNEIHVIPFVGGTLQALAQLGTIQSMKLEGCSKPDIIPQSQWDQG
jgi:glucose uptake protein GlcU